MNRIVEITGSKIVDRQQPGVANPVPTRMWEGTLFQMDGKTPESQYTWTDAGGFFGTAQGVSSPYDLENLISSNEPVEQPVPDEVVMFTGRTTKDAAVSALMAHGFSEEQAHSLIAGESFKVQENTAHFLRLAKFAQDPRLKDKLAGLSDHLYAQLMLFAEQESIAPARTFVVTEDVRKVTVPLSGLPELSDLWREVIAAIIVAILDRSKG